MPLAWCHSGRAIIHIGTAKTGSTSLQSFLHQNRNKLLEYGYAYLTTSGLKNQHKLATYCFDADQVNEHTSDLGISNTISRAEWKSNFKRQLLAEPKSFDRNVHTLIILLELFHSCLNSDAIIFRLKDPLSPLLESISTLVYLRRQDQLATSRYSTMIRSGLYLDRVLPIPNMESKF